MEIGVKEGYSMTAATNATTAPSAPEPTPRPFAPFPLLAGTTGDVEVGLGVVVIAMFGVVTTVAPPPLLFPFPPAATVFVLITLN